MLIPITKRTFLLCALLVAVLLTGGILYFLGYSIPKPESGISANAREKGKVPPLQQHTEAASSQQQGQEVSYPNLSWDRVEEIVRKSHEVDVIGDIPEGVSEEEDGIAFRMEIARLNSLADGVKYPWHASSFGVWRNGTEGWRMTQSWVFSPDGHSIEPGAYFEVLFDSNSICVWPMDKRNDRREFRCVDAGKGFPHIGLGDAAQVYGKKVGQAIHVSKIIFVSSVSLYPGSQFDNLQ